MDKYQIHYLQTIMPEEILSIDEKNAKVEILSDGKICVHQNEDYSITKYSLLLPKKDIKSVSYYQNQWIEAEQSEGNFIIPIDFAESLEKLKFEFDDGLIDNFETQVSFEYANKEEFDKKMAYELSVKRKQEMAPALSYQKENGITAIYFRPCCENVAYTIIKWIKDYQANVFDGHSTETIRTTTILEEKKIVGKMYDTIICGGSARAEIRQYDNNDNLLVEAEVQFS